MGNSGGGSEIGHIVSNGTIRCMGMVQIRVTKILILTDSVGNIFKQYGFSKH